MAGDRPPPYGRIISLPLTVARGPVPRERSIWHGGGQAPALR